MGRLLLGRQSPFPYNLFGFQRYDLLSPEKLTKGKHTIQVTITPDSPARRPRDGDDGGRWKTGRGHQAQEQVPMRCGTECMDVGMDCVSPVCDDYRDKGLFPFNGKDRLGDLRSPRRAAAKRARSTRVSQDGLARQLMPVLAGDRLSG
ncbi:MAG: hypothetical protein R2848_00860 [Thermomicrobiales bacterium]